MQPEAVPTAAEAGEDEACEVEVDKVEVDEVEAGEVEVDVAPGVCLRVRHWPAPGPSPYLLVHGLSSNARLWDEVAERLVAAGHPTYAVDLRSHGRSDAPVDGYDTATAAADVGAVADRLRLGRAIVVGQSWGGNVVVRLAAERPDLVAALALVDGGWIDLSAQFRTWGEAEAALRPPELDGLRADDLRAMLRRGHLDWSPRAIEATIANLRTEADGRLERRLPVAHHMRIIRSMWLEPPWPDLSKVEAPVLLLPAVPADAQAAESRRGGVRAAAAALAQARVREFIGADHDIHAQHPAALAAELLLLRGER
jgi:pimeloyl-ACP methyl ester carboxylesterase